MTSLPCPCRHPLPPIHTHVGDAQVSYVPGHWASEVTFVLCGRPMTCAASDARDLIAALQQALSDPLVESYRAARNAASAGGVPGGR